MTRAVDAFRQLVGVAPEGCWMAPGRVNLIGEHTDYNDGFVLPLALPQGAYVAAAARRDKALAVRSLQRAGAGLSLDREQVRPGAVSGWGAYAAGVVWALRDAGYAVGGVELVIDSDLVLGAGLSSSAALTCAVALACAEIFELDLTRTALAELARRAEHDFAGVPVGIMDHSASLLCRPGHLLLLDTRDLRREQIPFDPGAAGLALLVIDTRTPRELRQGAYAERRGDCERAARLLGLETLRDLAAAELDEALSRLPDPVLCRRVRHVVSENARVLEVAALLRGREMEAIGPLLTASHASLRDDYEVSSPPLDAAVEAALRAGALGARMTGAGFGGCALALVAETDLRAVSAAIAIAFERGRFVAPRQFAVVPAGGARRVWGGDPRCRVSRACASKFDQ
ncbi:MAG: galactokinase [Solirubrobacterales bacterium]